MKPVRGPDRRTAKTRVRLMEAAESLFGQYGIDGVSLRQISAAVQSANVAAVGYHFGTKESLIAEIIRYRVPVIEVRRAQLLALAEASGLPITLSVLLDALFRPFLEQVDDQGRHSYSRFLFLLIYSGRFELRRMMNSEFLVSEDIASRICALLPPQNLPHFLTRMLACSLLIFFSIQDGDLRQASESEAEDCFVDALRMASAVLSAPVG